MQHLLIFRPVKFWAGFTLIKDNMMDPAFSPYIFACKCERLVPFSAGQVGLGVVVVTSSCQSSLQNFGEWRGCIQQWYIEVMCSSWALTGFEAEQQLRQIKQFNESMPSALRFSAIVRPFLCRFPETAPLSLQGCFYSLAPKHYLFD